MESDSSSVVTDSATESTAMVRKRRKKATNAVLDAELDKVSKYFTRNDEDIKCNVVDCKSSLSRWTSYVLKRHLRQKHLSIYADLFMGEIEIETQRRVDAFTTMQHAVTLVTSDGYPFFLLDKPSFRSLIQPGLDTLARHGHIVTINRAEIVKEIDQVSKEVRSHITDELKGRFVSLMFDIATKRTLSVLGVSISFIANDEVVIRSLGIVHLTERHTGENIAVVVLDLLMDFAIPTTKIYAVTTDNGSNMVNTTRSINHMIEENNNCDESVELDGELEADMNTSNRFTEIINDMTQNLRLRNDYMALIPEIRCCAHTLQLAIGDGIAKSKADRVLAKVRQMCKSLRNQIINIEFRKLAPQTIIPPLDNETRWCSEYIMVIIRSFPPILIC